MKKRFDLIIFDCDGVLVDSERSTNALLQKMLNELGVPVTFEEMFQTFVGNSMERCVEIIEEKLGGPIPEGFIDEYFRRRETLLEKVQPVHGIHKALEQIQVPFCVASNGEHSKMITTLGVTQLTQYFEGKRFSATDVTQGKPFPDLYLYAAEKMGAKPESCLVIEDTPVGVQAGVAAGMTVFGYAKLTPSERLQKAGAVLTFQDMIQLPQLFQTASGS